MKIENFCSLLRRYTVKFEHHVTCIEKRDLHEDVAIEIRLQEFMKYFKENFHENEEQDERKI